MSLSRRAPFLRNLVLTRIRGRFMSLGIWAGVLILIVGCCLPLSRDHPAVWR